jgi:hypothetical protein
LVTTPTKWYALSQCNKYDRMNSIDDYYHSYVDRFIVIFLVDVEQCYVDFVSHLFFSNFEITPVELLSWNATLFTATNNNMCNQYRSMNVYIRCSRWRMEQCMNEMNSNDEKCISYCLCFWWTWYHGYPCLKSIYTIFE